MHTKQGSIQQTYSGKYCSNAICRWYRRLLDWQLIKKVTIFAFNFCKCLLTVETTKIRPPRHNTLYTVHLHQISAFSNYELWFNQAIQYIKSHGLHLHLLYSCSTCPGRICKTYASVTLVWGDSPWTTEGHQCDERDFWTLDIALCALHFICKVETLKRDDPFVNGSWWWWLCEVQWLKFILLLRLWFEVPRFAINLITPKWDFD